MPDNEEVILTKPTIDLSAWNSAVSSMLADAARIETAFEGAFGKGAAIDVKVDDSALKTAQRAIDDLDAGVTSEVDFKMTDDNIVKGTLDKLDAGTTAEVDFKATGDTEVKQILSDIEGKLGNLQKLALIKLALDVPAAAEGFITSLTNLPGVSTLIEMDTVLSQVEGRTGRMIPQAEELITELYTNAWGESVTAVGNVVTAASNLGIEMDDLRDATMAAFNLEALGIGEAEENLRTLDTMVKNGLAPDFATASDILAAGFQTGANRGQDLLDTFNEYGSTFNQLGISGEAALALINTGLEAGIDNSDRIADLIRETGIRLGEIHSDPNIQAAFTDLDNLSTIDLSTMLTGWEAGDISGDEMFGAIFQALEDAAASDPTKAKTLAATLMGTIAEDFGIEAVTQLSPVWDESLWGPLEDRAQIASDTVNDTLGTALTELFRTLEIELANTLDETFDFNALIDKAKQAIKDIAGALRSGEGLAEALEIGLNIPGFADQVHKIESAINNFLIGLLQAVADIGTFLGQDTSGLNKEIGRISAGQLAFDLTVTDNGEDIESTIQRAIDRGVDRSQLTDIGEKAVAQLIERGDIERAQELVAELSKIKGVVGGEEGQASYIGSIVDTEGMTEQINTAVADINQQFNDAVAAEDWDLAKTLGDKLGIDNLDTLLSDLINKNEFDISPTIMEDTAQKYSIALQKALAEGDYGQAASMSELLPKYDSTYGYANAQSAVRDFASDLNQALSDAIEAGDKQTAEDIMAVMGLSPDVFSTTIDLIKPKFDELGTTITGTLTDMQTVSQSSTAAIILDNQNIQGQVGETDTSFSDLGDTVDARVPIMAEEVEDFLTRIAEGSEPAIGMLVALATQFGSLADSAAAISEAAQNAGTGGTAPVPEFASGGTPDPGVFIAGENGPEAIFTNERLSVLNNATTDRLFTALRGDMIGGSITTNTRSNTVHAPIYVNNFAQGEQAAYQIVNAMRGYG